MEKPTDDHEPLCAISLWLEDRKEWCQTFVSPTQPPCDCKHSGQTGAEARILFVRKLKAAEQV